MMPYGGQGSQNWNNQLRNQWPPSTVGNLGLQDQQLTLTGLVPQYLGHTNILPAHNLYNPAAVVPPNTATTQWQHQQWQYNLQANKLVSSIPS